MKGVDIQPPVRAVELFVGSGGLAIATSMVGVEHAAVIEWNGACCSNIRANQEAGGLDNAILAVAGSRRSRGEFQAMAWFGFGLRRSAVPAL
jgi:hypothetical protein